MTMNNSFPPDPWEQNSYGTGSTQPPKKRGGLVAILFAAVIFLGGIVTALGLMNIRLSLVSGDSEQESTPPVLFAQESTRPATINTAPAAGYPSPGFTGQALSVRDQIIYKLPQGIYITQVYNNSDARKKGISPGDVLIRVGKTATCDLSQLAAALADYQSGDEVDMVISRGGRQYSVRIILYQEK